MRRFPPFFRTPRRGISGLVFVAVAAAILAGGRETMRFLRSETLRGAAEVIDGDSLRLGADEIRLEGIDAPEFRQTCFRGGVEEPCGRNARAALAGLVRRGVVDCRISGNDRFGRKLGTCRAGAVEINRAMVRDGQAVAFGAYEVEEAQAHAARRGIWATRFEMPADWRARHPRPNELGSSR